MRYLCFLIALLTPLKACAEQITPLAGEHRGFTRVVIPNVLDAEIELDDEGRRIEIRSPSAPNYALDELFTRISRNRLANATAKAGVLVLQLECNCGLRSYADARAGFVIDILDQAAPVTRPRSRPHMRTTTLADTDHSLNPAAWLINTTSPATVALRTAFSTSLSEGRDFETPSQPNSTPIGLAHSVVSTSSWTNIGILAVNPDAEPLIDKSQRTHCTTSEAFDPSAWSIEENYLDAVREARQSAVEDADQTLLHSLPMARTLIAFGQTDEAIHLLRHNGGSSGEELAALTIAKIVANEPVREDELPNNCSVAQSFWRALATRETDDASTLSLYRLTQYFHGLRPALRSTVAARVETLLSKAGAANLADLVASEQRVGSRPVTAINELHAKFPSTEVNEDLEPAQVAEIEALLVQSRHEPEFGIALRKSVDLMLKHQYFEATFDLIAQDEPAHLWDVFFGALAGNSSNEDFLRFAFRSEAGSVSATTKAAIEQRSREIGLIAPSKPSSQRLPKTAPEAEIERSRSGTISIAYSRQQIEETDALIATLESMLQPYSID